MIERTTWLVVSILALLVAAAIGGYGWVPFGLFAATLLVVGRLREIQIHKMDLRSGAISILSGSIVGILAIVTQRIFAKDVVFSINIDRPAIYILVPAILATAILNSVFEELIWRGLLLDLLQRLFPNRINLSIQSASFGLAHLNGFPGGWAGVLAASGFGFLQGQIVRRTGSISVAIAVHFVVDLWIFTYIYMNLNFEGGGGF